MLLLEYVGHIGLRSLTDSHLRRHLEYFKTLNDARVASVGFIKYNASTSRINKEKNFKIKFLVILVFYWTIILKISDLFLFTNRVDPDEMQHYAAFYLGLHCLQKYSFRGFQNTKG